MAFVRVDRRASRCRRRARRRALHRQPLRRQQEPHGAARSAHRSRWRSGFNLYLLETKTSGGDVSAAPSPATVSSSPAQVPAGGARAPGRTAGCAPAPVTGIARRWRGVPRFQVRQGDRGSAPKPRGTLDERLGSPHRGGGQGGGGARLNVNAVHRWQQLAREGQVRALKAGAFIALPLMGSHEAARSPADSGGHIHSACSEVVRPPYGEIQSDVHVLVLGHHLGQPDRAAELLPMVRDAAWNLARQRPSALGSRKLGACRTSLRPAPPLGTLALKASVNAFNLPTEPDDCGACAWSRWSAWADRRGWPHAAELGARDAGDAGRMGRRACRRDVATAWRAVRCKRRLQRGPAMERGRAV